MTNLFGFELSTGLRWIIAFAIVLALVALFAFFLRRITGGRLKFKGQGGGRTRQPRLGVIDIHDLDRQRQLILVRRDNVEHLIMIGGGSDVVIETNIMRSGGRVAMPGLSDATMERPLAFEPLQAPEPARPEFQEEPRRAPPLPTLQPQPAPLPVEAPVQPPQAPSAPVPPPVPANPVPPARQAAVAATSTIIATAGPAFSRESSPAPSASSGELDDMARQLEEALKRPFSAVRPSSGAPAPEPRPEPEAAVPAFTPSASVGPAPKPAPSVFAGFKPQPPAAERSPAPPPAPAPVRPALDMEAELEMALGLKPVPTRSPVPDAPVVAPPVVAAPEQKPIPMPEPVKAEAPKAEPAKAEPVKVAPKLDVPKPEVAKPEPAKPEAVKAEVAKPEAVKPEPAKAEPVKAAKAEPAPAMPDVKAEAAAKPEAKVPEAKAQEAKPQEAKAQESKAKDAGPEADDAGKPARQPAEDAATEAATPAETKAEPAALDPFSVDAIEAEFARLLGREVKPKG